MDTAATTSTMLSSDPVSSLRAAALSTLKAKRRKFVPEKTSLPPLPRPPPPADTFQLDYGQEDNIPDAPMADVTLSDVNKPPPSAIEPATIAEDPNREEGEISEEEEPPPKTVSPTNKLFSSENTGLIKSRSPSPLSSATPLHNSPEVASPLALMDRLSDPLPSIPVLGLDEQPVADQNVEASPPFFLIGPENVRPGLTITQAEYDTIKNIILDLLGWAVPVDDLIQSGLSKEVIYYVFNELNLQLPDTFDITGIVPYNPETFSQASHPDMIPTIAFSGMRSSVEPDSPTGAPLMRATTPPAPTKLVSTFDSPSNADLHDMERRRRQELMARKAAVQASRKSKPSIESFTTVVQPEPSNMPMEDADMTPIASETVEDFLKSLAPATKQSPPIVSMPPQTEIFDTNDADKATITFFDDPESQGRSPHLIIPTSASSADSDLQHTFTPPSSTEPPPTSVDSSITTFSHSSGADPELLTPSDVQFIPRQTNAPALRRGTKRPVASDFVDFDPTPRRNEINARHERSNGFVRPAPVRRLTGTSFHNIGGSRRCVIDLSDSEEDGDMYQSQPVEDQTLARRDKWNNTGGKHPSPAPSTKPPSTPGAMSPAALMQKELEIRKMRELIARREEETRLRKLALARSAANSETTTPSNGGTRLKQEEIDADMPSPASIPIVSNGMAPLPPTFPLEPSRTPWEDSTMTTLPGFSKPSTSSTIPRNIAIAGGNRIPGPASQAQEAQAIDPQMEQKQQAKETIVDDDSSLSPSTQMTPMTPAPQKQDERSEPSNLNNNSDDINDFSTYRSPFESFPLLRGCPGPMLLSDPVSSLSSSSASHMYPSTRSSLSSIPYFVYAEHSTFPHSSSPSSPAVLLPDLKPLKLASQVKVLDPFKRLCQYEVPGGGTCRDDGCEDVHLSRLEGANQMGQVEPTDQATAEYLFKVMPAQWLAERRIDSPTKIYSTLQHLYQRTADNSLCYEDRVAQALMALGPPSAT